MNWFWSRVIDWFIQRGLLFQHIHMSFPIFHLCSACFSLEFHTLLYLYLYPLRHTNNNYFLNAYQHIWLELKHENSDSGSLLSMLTVKLMLPLCNRAYLNWPSLSFRHGL